MPPLVSTKPFGYSAGICENGSEMSSTLGIYPNPCSTQLTYVFFISEEKSLAFHILDINGKFVSEIRSQFFTKGVHLQNVNTSSLKAGVYFIVAESTKGIEMKARFIKQ